MRKIVSKTSVAQCNRLNNFPLNRLRALSREFTPYGFDNWFTEKLLSHTYDWRLFYWLTLCLPDSSTSRYMWDHWKFKLKPFDIRANKSLCFTFDKLWLLLLWRPVAIHVVFFFFFKWFQISALVFFPSSDHFRFVIIYINVFVLYAVSVLCIWCSLHILLVSLISLWDSDTNLPQNLILYTNTVVCIEIQKRKKNLQTTIMMKERKKEKNDMRIDKRLCVSVFDYQRKKRYYIRSYGTDRISISRLSCDQTANIYLTSIFRIFRSLLLHRFLLIFFGRRRCCCCCCRVCMCVYVYCMYTCTCVRFHSFSDIP